MKPLLGKRVMTTRPRHQAAGLTEALEGLGAIVDEVPMVTIAPAPDMEALDLALGEAGDFDWLVFTSVNGVDAVRDRLYLLGLDARVIAGCKLAAIGPATAEALKNAFREPDLMPSEYVSEAIAEGLGDVSGLRFLLLRADIARKDLAHKLVELGAEVLEVAAYQILRNTEAALPPVAPDVITLTSSEIARATVELFRAQGREDWLATAKLACIGPITARTVTELGFEPLPMPANYDVPGLVAAIADYYSAELANA